MDPVNPFLDDFDAMLAGHGLSPNFALTEAIFHAEPDQAALALARGADPNAISMSGRSALSLACLRGEAACVAHLLRAGANPTAQSSHADPCCDAASHGHLDCVKAFFPPDRAPLTAHPLEAMLAAAGTNRLACVAFLAQRSELLLPCPTRSGQNALMAACGASSLECAHFLLPLCDPRPLDDNGLNALYLAMSHEHFALARLIVQRVDILNQRDALEASAPDPAPRLGKPPRL